MKSKYIFTVVVGFVIFVHAHYISSWINYYEAPMLNRTQFNDKLNAGHSSGYGEPAPVYSGELTADTLSNFTGDSIFLRSGTGSAERAFSKE